MITVKFILKKMGGCELGSSGSEQRSVLTSCEYSNKLYKMMEISYQDSLETLCSISLVIIPPSF
jgi:hypothetical protein